MGARTLLVGELEWDEAGARVDWCREERVLGERVRGGARRRPEAGRCHGPGDSRRHDGDGLVVVGRHRGDGHGLARGHRRDPLGKEPAQVTLVDQCGIANASLEC